MMYALKGLVPDGDHVVPLGLADVKREGEDVTIIATSSMVQVAPSAADELEREGVSVEVVDPRTIAPLDRETLVASARKTGRVVVADEGPQSYGASAELAAVVAEDAFWHLDAPVVRLGPMDGTLAGISAAEGDDVPVGRAIAYGLAEGEDLPQAIALAAAAAVSASPAVVATTNGSSTAAETPARRVLASPKARRLASEHGVRLADLQGTGPHGAIQAADVVRQEARSRAASVQPVVSNAWKTMAERMQQSWRDVP